MNGPLDAWAASGAMALTGRRGAAPLGPPGPLVDRLTMLGTRLAGRSLDPIDIDPLALLGERAAIAGLGRRGDVSCGGGTRLLRCADGWLAVTLVRDDDRSLMAAWLRLDEEPADPWATVTRVVRTRDASSLERDAGLLGLPVAALPCSPVAPPVGAGPFAGLPVVATTFASATRATIGPPTVVDLSSLWAGPLCTNLLQLSGARVIKVESTHRPDGARLGPPTFFDVLNAGKASVALDLHRREGVAALGRLLAAADVVVEASRPRALEQLGIRAADVLAEAHGPSVWVSITSHGRTVDGGLRAGFGDDAAVAGGLIVRDDRGPCFCADAIADPTTGVVAAVAASTALASGRRWLIDVAMRGVAAWLAGEPLDASAVDPAKVAPPQARQAMGPAAALGRDTNAVLADAVLTHPVLTDPGARR